MLTDLIVVGWQFIRLSNCRNGQNLGCADKESLVLQRGRFVLPLHFATAVRYFTKQSPY